MKKSTTSLIARQVLYTEKSLLMKNTKMKRPDTSWIVWLVLNFIRNQALIALGQGLFSRVVLQESFPTEGSSNLPRGKKLC